jgi:hypothetical protein
MLVTILGVALSLLLQRIPQGQLVIEVICVVIIFTFTLVAMFFDTWYNIIFFLFFFFSFFFFDTHKNLSARTRISRLQTTSIDLLTQLVKFWAPSTKFLLSILFQNILCSFCWECSFSCF